MSVNKEYTPNVTKFCKNKNNSKFMSKNNEKPHNNTNNKFNLINWNANSLNNKIDEFKLFCIKLNPQIISINETKMNEFMTNYILNVENYTTVHLARNERNGAGGVALFIRNDIKFSKCVLF